VTGHRLCQEFIVALGLVKKAAAKANMKTGRMPLAIGNAIVKASEEIVDGNWHDQFVVDSIQGGAGTSMNMNANEVIANRALEVLGHAKGAYELVSPNNHVNMAQSTNDVIPTSIRIAALYKSRALVKELEDLLAALLRKSEEFSAVIKMGRTHLQDAVPITLGQEFTAYASMINRSIIRVRNAQSKLLSVNMGATAVGTGLNAEPEYIVEVVRELSRLTNLPFNNAENLVDATQNTDELAELSGALKICAISLSKIANDLRMMASGPRCGLNELSLPALQPGSSIMPGKINPVIPEMINQVAFQVIGNDHVVCMAVEAGQFELNVMEPVLAYNLFNSLSFLTNAVNAFTHKCIVGLIANEERCRELVDGSVGIVTALLPHLGYEAASVIAKEALQTKQSVRDIIFKRGLMTSEQLQVVLSPVEMTRPGIAGKQYLKSVG
jgi:aspartate ammonia-lyase